MAFRPHRLHALAALTAGVASLATSPAAASGYLTARYGADLGNPMTGNPFAVYHNPAAMSATTGTQLSLDATILARSVTYDRPTSALSPSVVLKPRLSAHDLPAGVEENYAASNSGRAQLSNVAALPFLGFVSDLGGTNFRVGGAFYVPYGGSADWGRNTYYETSSTVPGGYDGAQRWSSISGSILASYATLAASYMLPDLRLALGVSGSAVMHSVSSVRARNADGSDDTQTPNGGLYEGRAILTGKSVQAALGAGIYWEPLADRSIRVGASYASQPGFGQSKLDAKLDLLYANTSYADPAKRISSNEYDFLTTYPDVYRLGAAWRISEKFEARLDGAFIRWSVLKNQCVVTKGSACENVGINDTPDPAKVIVNLPRNWKDTFAIRAGGSWYPNPDVEVFGSAAYATPAVPKETIDAATVDSTRFTGSAGARFVLTPSFQVAASVAAVYFVPVDTAGASTLNKYASTVSRSPSADGVYKSFVPMVDLNGTYTF